MAARLRGHRRRAGGGPAPTALSFLSTEHVDPSGSGRSIADTLKAQLVERGREWLYNVGSYILSPVNKHRVDSDRLALMTPPAKIFCGTVRCGGTFRHEGIQWLLCESASAAYSGVREKFSRGGWSVIRAGLSLGVAEVNLCMY